MMYFYIVFLLIICAHLICSFVYPKDSLPENCTLPNGIEGVCRNIKDCPAVLNSKKDPLKCYFLGSEYFVCCAQQVDDQRLKKLKEAEELLRVTNTKTSIQMQDNQFLAAILFKTNDEFLLPLKMGELITSSFSTSTTTTTQMNLRLSAQKCRSYKRPFAPVVVKGIETGAYEFPYMVALGWIGHPPTVFDFKCGGVLIDSKFVLTAAHCAWADNQKPIVVLPGGIKLSYAQGNTINVKKITIHPAYRPETIYNDIAIIELEKEIQDERACLWSEIEPKSNNLTVIGYGHTKYAGVSSEKLLKAYLQPVPNDYCQRFYEDTDDLPSGLSTTQLCAIDPELIRDTCQGDSGGPLVKKLDGQDYVVGITSYGIGCATDAPSIYTRVSSYINWIENIVWS